MPLSLCMIVKDEEKTLSRCLDSVKHFVDEIIIVDTGSRDNTIEIAKKYTDMVYRHPWTDFADVRNFSLSKATKDWILVLDADEVISKDDMDKIKEMIKGDENAYLLIQRNYSNDSTLHNWKPADDYPECLNYNGYIKSPNIRLFRNKQGIRFSGVVHAIVSPSLKQLGIKPVLTDIPIHHYHEEKDIKERQLKYLDMIEEKLKTEPGPELYFQAASICLNFKKDYDKAIIYFKKAKDYRKHESKEGIAECLVKQKKFKEAYNIYKDLALSGYLTGSLCNNTANILLMHKRYKPALKFFKLALQKGNPNRKRIMKNIKRLEQITH